MCILIDNNFNNDFITGHLHFFSFQINASVYNNQKYFMANFCNIKVPDDFYFSAVVS